MAVTEHDATAANATGSQVQPLQSDLLRSDKVRHGFYTRRGGVSSGLYAGLNCGQGSGDAPANVAANRSRVADDLGVAANRLATLYQVHSPRVIVIDGPISEPRPQADGLVSRTPNLALGILTADCTPVLLADVEHGVIGAAHAGWKGALSGIIANVIGAMESLGAQRSAIRAAIGPTISQSNYEVGPEFHARFLEENSANGRYFVPSSTGQSGHWMFDLPGYVADLVRAERVGAVQTIDACTYADPDLFFSYRRATHRREPDYGRNISAVALHDDGA